jgi:hypothetical protein
MKKNILLKTSGILLSIFLLGGIFYLRAVQNYSTQDYPNSNFFFFWLAGRMVLNGENPYDQSLYLAGHEAFGAAWRPNKIFPYPLPLSLFMVPLGLVSLGNAYIIWQIISQILIAITVFILLNHWKEPAQRRLFVPVMLFLLFFGPVFLTLQIGSIGALTLVIMLSALFLLEKEKSLLAGLILSLTILKPPQGATILFLTGIWFIARREWKAILGIAIGGLALFLIGYLQDPLWLIKFRTASQAVMDRTQGIHSNVWSFAYLACKGTSPCFTLLGAAGALTLLGLGGLLLWRKQAELSAWEAMNFIIPIGFVSTVYLWAYDQILYVIPIIWIVGTLVQKRKSYMYAFLFLLILVLYSFIALALHAQTSKDLWSLGNTLIVLGAILLATRLKQKSPIDTSSTSTLNLAP